MRRNARRFVIGAAVISALAVAPASAEAGAETYCWNKWVAAGGTCPGDRHSLRQNWAQNYAGDQSKSVAAAAKDVNFNMYGSWVYGYGSVCHSYSGQNLLYPYIMAAQVGQYMGGTQYYGSESACP